MAGNHGPDHLSVRPLSPEARLRGWRTWKCWVAVQPGRDYRSYSRRQGPATIAFNGELYWDLDCGVPERYVQNERE
jgi:hypothetical protein